MTSQALALQPLPGVQGLVFFGFPLHPAGKPSVERAAHLTNVHVPMLFIQGTRDKLAEPALIHGVVKKLGPIASLCEIDGADHSARPGQVRPSRCGRVERSLGCFHALGGIDRRDQSRAAEFLINGCVGIGTCCAARRPAG
jgi:hypothetical protein